MTTELSKFSLIYPSAEAQTAHYSGECRPNIDMFVLDELGLLEVFNLKSSNLDEFFTTDRTVIKHRMDVFEDMLAFPEISVTLNKLMPILTDIMELRRLEADTGETESYLESITEIELYIASISTLNNGFSPIKDALKSEAMRTLAFRIAELADSDYYKELNIKLSELTNRVRDIRSVTIGVNLDAQLRPSSAGVLSINPEPFRSGDVIEKILRFNFKDDEYTCIANLVPFSKKQSENQRTALALAFNSAAALVSAEKNTMPFIGGDIIEIEGILANGDICGGYGGLYLGVERAGVSLGSSEHVKFVQEQTVFKASARYDGKPIDGAGFVLFNYKNQTPTTTATFAEDKANAEPAGE